VSGQLHGILSLEDLKSLPRDRWSTTRVQSVNAPGLTRFFVPANTTLDSAQAVMKQNGVGSIAIVDARGKLIRFPAKRLHQAADKSETSLSQTHHCHAAFFRDNPSGAIHFIT
jgi:CBS domain-containing protein